MTEDEAKQKWCPFSRDSNTAGNRCRAGVIEGDNDFGQYAAEAAQEFPCIGSACMAWAWSYTGHEQVTLPLAETPEGDGWTKARYVNDDETRTWSRPRRPTQGFCGLAARPEVDDEVPF